MIHNEVRQYAANQDIRELKFWFKGSLDGDTTFQKYEEDYAYCKEAIPQLFEPYRELTPLSLAHVDAGYWTQLKNDLMENFSEKRFQHMKQAAQIFYRERLSTIQPETRTAASDEQMLMHTQVAAQVEKNYLDHEEAMRRQQQADAERIARLRAENAEKQCQEAERQRRLQEAAQQQQYHIPQEEQPSKKASGLNYTPLIIIAIIIVLIILIVSGHKPE